MRNFTGIFTKRTLLTLVLVVAIFTMVFMGGQQSAHALSDNCAQYYTKSGVLPPSGGDYIAGTFEAGEVITVTTALVGPGTAVFRITNSATNYAGPTSVPGTLTYTVPFTGLYVIGFQTLSGSTANVQFTVSCAFGGPSGAVLPLFTDGRENKNDALQTAAIYCGVPHAGDVRVYALYNNIGTIAFTISKAELAVGVQKPATPYLIESAKGAELWRLQNGSLLIKRGAYVFDWPGC